MTRLTEPEVGITEYISPFPGFKGALKYRFSDFIVNEIDKKGNVVRLTDTRVPTVETTLPSEATGVAGEAGTPEVDEATKTQMLTDQGLVALSAVIGEEQITQVRAFVEKASSEKAETGTEVRTLVLPPEADKTKRTQIHQLVRQYFPLLSTDTVQVAEGTASAIRLFVEADAAKANKKNKRQKTDGKKGGVVQGGHGNSFYRADYAGKKYCCFTLYKENMDTLAAVNLLSKLLQCKPANLSYAGTKDKRACTTQQITGFHMDPKRLVHLNRTLKNALIGNFQYSDEPLRLGDLSGNRFEIVLRNVSAPEAALKEACEGLKARGFINYFGMQRFGSSASISTHSIGIAILKSKWEEVTELILRPRPGEREEVEKARNHFAEKRDPKAALRMFPQWMANERIILEAFAKQGMKDHRNAFGKLPRNMRTMYAHAYQSFIWNHMVSERIRVYGSNKAVEGDLVLVEAMEGAGTALPVAALGKRKAEGGETANQEESGREAHLKQVHILTAEQALTTSIFKVVMPLPGNSVIYPGHSVGQEAYGNKMAEDGLDVKSMDHTDKEFHLAGDYRNIMASVESLEWDTKSYGDPKAALQLTDMDRINGRDESYLSAMAGNPEGGGKESLALRVRFNLESSQYATMCLRELLKEYVEEATQGI